MWTACSTVCTSSMSSVPSWACVPGCCPSSAASDSHARPSAAAPPWGRGVFYGCAKSHPDRSCLAHRSSQILTDKKLSPLEKITICRGGLHVKSRRHSALLEQARHCARWHEIWIISAAPQQCSSKLDIAFDLHEICTVQNKCLILRLYDETAD